MQRAYKSAAREIERRLKEVERLIATAAAENAEARVSWLLMQERYRALLDQVYVSVDQFSLSAEEVAKKQQSINASRGTKHAGSLVKLEFQGAGVRLPQSFKLLNQEALNSMVGVLRDGSPLRTLFREIAPNAVKVAHETFIAGLAVGDNPRLIGRKMAKQVEELSLERAVRIARNESLRAYTDAQQRTYIANSDVVSRSRIQEALDEKTCPICWARHGTFVEHDEFFYKHVTCRGALFPVLEFSPRRRTGEEILRTKPEAYQREVLGPARYELWKSGQIELGDIAVNSLHPKWGPQPRLRRLDELRNLPPKSTVQTAPSRLPIAKETSSFKTTKYEEIPNRIRSKNKENLVLLDSEKKHIATFEGTDRGVRLPEERLSQIQSVLASGFAVHNHPEGGPVSPADLRFTLDHGLSEHVIVMKDADVKLSSVGLSLQAFEAVVGEFAQRYDQAESLALAKGLEGAEKRRFIRKAIHEWYRLLGIQLEEDAL